MQIATEISDVYRNWTELLLNPSNTDFDAEGVIFRLIFADDRENGTIYGIDEEQLFVPGREGMADKLQQFVKAGRRRGLQVIAMTSESNAWNGPRPLPGEKDTGENCRIVALVDVDGVYHTAMIVESDPTTPLASDPMQLSEIDEAGLQPAQMLAAIRGVKAPRCYLCARQHELRPYGSKIDGHKTRFSGMWSCWDTDAEGCQRRADRKFSKKQLNRALKDAASAMVNCVPDGEEYDDLRTEIRKMIPALHDFHDSIL